MANHPVIYFIPTEKDVAELQVGHRALDPFGRWAAVTEISFRGTDVRGFQFVGYYVQHGLTGTISGTYKVGELVRHVGLPHKSSETTEIEAAMRKRKLGLITVEPGLTIHKVLTTTPLSRE